MGDEKPHSGLSSHVTKRWDVGDSRVYLCNSSASFRTHPALPPPALCLFTQPPQMMGMHMEVGRGHSLDGDRGSILEEVAFVLGLRASVWFVPLTGDGQGLGGRKPRGGF